MPSMAHSLVPPPLNVCAGCVAAGLLGSGTISAVPSHVPMNGSSCFNCTGGAGLVSWACTSPDLSMPNVRFIWAQPTPSTSAQQQIITTVERCIGVSPSRWVVYARRARRTENALRSARGPNRLIASHPSPQPSPLGGEREQELHHARLDRV